MKKYTYKMNYKLLFFFLFIFAASSCTKDFDGLNVDKGDISDVDLQKDGAEAAFLLPVMMNNIISTSPGEQTQQNLQAESYAGYLEAPSNFLGNVNTTTYVTRGIWESSYTISVNGVMNNWLTMKRKGFDTKYPDLYAIALIMKVAAGQRLVDTFGPFPYSKYGDSAEPAFDSPAAAYAAMFLDLDQAVANLLTAETQDPNADQTRFKKWDRSTLAGEYTNWIKLANTLRLRMGIRISVVDPANGKIQAEKAVLAASGGVLDATTGSFSVAPPSGTNPHYTMTNAWSDTRISAAVVTYLQGFGDPRLPAYVLPALDPALNGTYRGIRPGVERPTKSVYENYSRYNVAQAAPMKVVDVAESYFLKAEGVLRGWNMGGSGTAATFYEAGVRASIAANGVAGADTYLQSTSTQLAYVDPKRPDYASAPLTTNVVKWDEAANFETKLEKIITQKWIAVFPEGTEGWSEFRRTGYPKQYFIMSPQNPVLPLGTYIKRLTYPTSVVTSSQNAYNAAVAAFLGGVENEATKFYWMK
jgi:hypothetical protein